MLISDDKKIPLFELAAFYLAPLFLILQGTAMLSVAVESLWLPSEKDGLAYQSAFWGLVALRILGAGALPAWFLIRGRRVWPVLAGPRETVTGALMGFLLMGFFLGLTALSTGFAVIHGQGFLTLLETLVAEWLPLLLVLGWGLGALLPGESSYWKHLFIAALLSAFLNFWIEAATWAQGGPAPAAEALFPSASLLVAIGVLRRFGVIPAIGTLGAAMLALGACLQFDRFPNPGAANSVLTLGCAVLLARATQVLRFPRTPPRGARSRSAEEESARPEPG